MISEQLDRVGDLNPRMQKCVKRLFGISLPCFTKAPLAFAMSRQIAMCGKAVTQGQCHGLSKLRDETPGSLDFGLVHLVTLRAKPDLIHDERQDFRCQMLPTC